MVSLIDPEAFEKMFVNWVKQNLKLPEGTLVSIDGKKLRWSASKQAQQTSRADGGKSAEHLVEAWCSSLSLCLSTRKVDDKTNEIKAIPWRCCMDKYNFGKEAFWKIILKKHLHQKIIDIEKPALPKEKCSCNKAKM